MNARPVIEIEKQALRETTKQRLYGITTEEWARHSVVIQQRITCLPPWQTAQCLGCYLATGHEVDTRTLLRHAWHARKTIAVPTFNQSVHHYYWRAIAVDTPLAPGAFGILEPPAGPGVGAEELQVVLVPGLAFDRHGGRLGHGHGYFDELLAGAGFKIGLAIEAQMVAAVPVAAHDVCMDLVVTEQALYFNNKPSLVAGLNFPPGGMI